jgi:hypothetical protein
MASWSQRTQYIRVQHLPQVANIGGADDEDDEDTDGEYTGFPVAPRSTARLTDDIVVAF